MLSAPDKALLVKLFLHERGISDHCLAKLESWRIEHELDDHVKKHVHTLHCCRNGSDCVEAASGTSSAHEAARRLGLPPSSVRNILRRSSSCTHTRCNRAANFCQQIPHKGKAFPKWAASLS
ncbi:hypothetical protein TNCV_58391 [Trichonephila clavipes]|nr:hypothetical protein TNCV_58391 [Trichonephila clavipes]